MTNVVTRIAPSPTGDMHIGTARTALFNYLYAKHMGGKFVLRVEDTDRERSTADAVKVILDGLKWLGLDYDGDPVFQSSNLRRHLEVAFELVDRGMAYLDYMTPEAADAWKAENRGKAFRSPYRDMADQPHEGPYVVRFKVPVDQDIVVDDLVKGPITFTTANLDDIVLLRSDGSPTYNLAVVVDDHDMGVTHVIRGDDHVNNTPRQMLIYKAMNVFPTAIRDLILQRFAGQVSPMLRIWKDRADQVRFDQAIPVDVEAAEGLEPSAYPRLAEEIGQLIRSQLQVRIAVTVLAPGSVPRGVYKTPLVVVRG